MARNSWRRSTDKHAIAFADSTTVPLIIDGDTAVADSWRIAQYRDARYPERSLFGDR